VTEQGVAAVFAWGVAILLWVFTAVLFRQRRPVPWPVSFWGAIGMALLLTSAAIGATLLALGPLPILFVYSLIVIRALASAILLGTIMRLTDRPRWLMRRMDGRVNDA
jgi:hypothetical protein